MRVWEVEDNRVIPSDLVREQDFILRLRRLHRIGAKYAVANLLLASMAPDYKGRGPLEEAQERLQYFAKNSGGTYVEMSNGDVFLMWPENETAKSFADKALAIVLTEGPSPADEMTYCLRFRLPADYALLRERGNHYVDVSREATEECKEGTPQILLQSETARGPLTAWSADQIGKLLQDIDVHRYLRTQPVYDRAEDGTWRPFLLELYIGIEDLRRAHFPKMSFAPSDHLFLELCQTIDRRLLSELGKHTDILTGHNISLNLSVSTLLGSVFAQFAFSVPHASHSMITCELNNGDLWQDFSLSLGALDSLKKEGFKAAIDGVLPSTLPYINFGLFDVGWIKINASKDHVASLSEPAVRKALKALPSQKVIFFRCDSEQALAAGIELGVSRFQGWHIDDLVKQAQGFGQGATTPP